MIIALLVLVVLILLFGAAAVKGWLANTIILFCLVTATVVTLAWISSLVGMKMTHLAYIIGGLLFVGSLWAKYGNAD